MATTRVTLNIPAFRKLRTSPEARKMVQTAIDRIAEEANRQAGGGFEASMSPGRNRARGVVYAATKKAQIHNGKHLTLLRSVDAGRI